MWVNVHKAGHGGRSFVDSRIILHSAATQRVDVLIDAEHSVGKSRVVAYYVQFADFRQLVVSAAGQKVAGDARGAICFGNIRIRQGYSAVAG